MSEEQKPSVDTEEEFVVPKDHVYPKNWGMAVLQVMSEVRNVEKKLTVGTGTSSYKGVSDKDVKYALSRAMIRAGLVISPIKLKTKLHVTSWEETDQYGKTRIKSSYFTEVKGKYEILHAPTGESKIIRGYGHGVDSQDKSAGKAMTYAQKYALLHQFMVATGTIDDADKDHSDEIPLPLAEKKQPASTATTQKKTEQKKPAKTPEQVVNELPWLTQKNADEWAKAIAYVQAGNTINSILAKKQMSDEDRLILVKNFVPKSKNSNAGEESKK